jgi:hypothetical protein
MTHATGRSESRIRLGRSTGLARVTKLNDSGILINSPASRHVSSEEPFLAWLNISFYAPVDEIDEATFDRNIFSQFEIPDHEVQIDSNVNCWPSQLGVELNPLRTRSPSVLPVGRAMDV